MRFAAAILLFAPPLCQAYDFSADDAVFLGSSGRAAIACSKDSSSPSCLNSLITRKDFLLAAEPDCKAAKTPSQNFFCLCKRARFSGEYSAALENCRKALQHEPADENIHLEMAVIHFQRKNYIKAAESAEAALAAAPGMKNALYLLAMSLESSGDSSGALKNIAKLEKLIKPGDTLYKQKKEALSRKKADLSKKAAAESAKTRKNLSLSCRQEYLNIPPHEDEKLYEKGKQCLSYGEKADSLIISHIRICIKLGKYEEAREALKLLEKVSKSQPKKIEGLILSADLYLKNGREQEAMKELDKAFNMGMDNAYWLEKYSRLAEQNGDYSRALEAMEAIREKDDLAKSRVEYLKDKALPDETVLKDLITRQALPEGSSFLGPLEKKLFLSMRAAERNGAAEYISKKYMGFAGLLVETLDGSEFSRKLTLKGFNIYMRDISQKAVRFFEKKGISLNEIFKLRTLSGQDYFDKTGKLTEEGFMAYLESLGDESKKNWLRVYEEAPAAPSPEKTQYDARAQQLISRGYMEISEGEYLWLMKETECPDMVLLSSPCDVKTIKSDKTVRYFICYKEGLCTREALILSNYVGQYRNDGGRKLIEGQTHSGFFGSGGSVKRKFCYKGRIWNGLD